MPNSKLAIIPARGGSKRIPRKNIKSFLGKPIIGYSIEAALSSGMFDEVMVSTDDEEIAEIAKQFGATMPFFRSKENSDDIATTVDVILEVLHTYESFEKHFDFSCCIYPSAPFVTKDILKRAYLKMTNNCFDSVFPVIKYSHPIQRAIKLGEEDKIELLFEKSTSSRTQDLEEAYYDAGQFYWFKNEVVKQEKKVWTNNTGVIVLSDLEAQDIDDPTDWTLAEIKYKYIRDVKTKDIPES